MRDPGQRGGIHLIEQWREFDQRSVGEAFDGPQR
jgi:hypothetical protein